MIRFQHLAGCGARRLANWTRHLVGRCLSKLMMLMTVAITGVVLAMGMETKKGFKGFRGLNRVSKCIPQRVHTEENIFYVLLIIP